MGEREFTNGYAIPPRIVDVPDDQALALFDLDGTLTTPGSELIIQKFINDVQIGAYSTRKELTDLFKKWKEENEKGANPDYQQYLTDVGDSWARLLAREGYNPTRPELMQITENWFEKKGKLEIKDYAGGVIDTVRERLIRPIMVTGAPFPIAFHFARHLGIEHAFGMEVEVDSHERYLDIVKHNTGLANAKLTVCDRLKEKGRKILFAMGDTHADSELWYAAIGTLSTDSSRSDGKGRAVFINPRPEALAECKRWCAGILAKKKLIVIEQHTARWGVIKIIRTLLDEILEENLMKNGLIDRVE